MTGVAEAAEAVVAALGVTVQTRAPVEARIEETLVHVDTRPAAAHRALGAPDTRVSH